MPPAKARSGSPSTGQARCSPPSVRRPGGPGLGAAAGYHLSDDGTLTPTSPSVNNGGTDTCWFVRTDDGTIGFTTSFFGDGRISSYPVEEDGSLELLQADTDPSVHTGPSDLSFSRDSPTATS